MAKLGSKKRPLVLRVQDPDRGQEVSQRCQEIGAHYVVGIEPDKPEDISDIERFLGTRTSQRSRPKIGRNDPCCCGSGKKYKKCCQAKDQETALALREQKRLEEKAAADQLALMASFEEDIEEYSDRVVDFIDEGDLVAAEKACVELEKKFPELIDCPERRAMLCEARGELEQAISYNKRCLEIIAAAPEGEYETAFIYDEAIERLQSVLASKSNITTNEG